MKEFKNEYTKRKWIELILAVYNGEYFYNKLKKEQKKISERKAIKQLENQLMLLKMRIPQMSNISLNDIINFNFV